MTFCPWLRQRGLKKKTSMPYARKSRYLPLFLKLIRNFQYIPRLEEYFMPTLQRRTVLLIVCLLLLYISWGSTFLGNKVALEFFPSFMLAGIRFFLAGAALLAFTYFRREASSIGLKDLKFHSFSGILLVFISSGFVVKAQDFGVPSGMTAILFGAAPIWLMLGQWLLWGGKKPTAMQGLGLFLGFSALIVLNIHQGIGGETSPLGLGMILFATVAWVYGSHYSQIHKYDTNLSLLRSTGLLLFLGGLQTLIVSLLLGERITITNLPLEAYLVLGYLVIFSSLIAYTTYIWLLFNSRAIVAISYEYVVPVIAIGLGALFADEQVDAIIIGTAVILISSVFLITSSDRK